MGDGTADDGREGPAAGRGDVLAALSALRDALERDAAASERAVDAGWCELAGRLLGDMNDACLLDLEARAGVTGLLALREELDDRIAAVQARRAVLVEMEEVAHASDVAARLDAELVAVQRRLADLERELGVWEASPDCQVLVRRGFFAADYRAGFWGRRRDARALGRLVAALEAQGISLGGADRDAVAAAHAALVARVAGARAVALRVAARRERQQGLERERIALSDAPTRLHGELRAALISALRDPLEAGPIELRYELAREDPEVGQAFRRLDGLAARGRYLRQLIAARVAPWIAAGEASAEAVQEAAIAELERVRAALVSYERWHEGGLGGQRLWWDLMTGGAPGEDLPEVRGFHAAWAGGAAGGHPAEHLEAELERTRAAAAARSVATQETEDDSDS